MINLKNLDSPFVNRLRVSEILFLDLFCYFIEKCAHLGIHRDKMLYETSLTG